MQGKAPDWQDFVGIITLLLINSTISFIEENNAGNAAAALMARLAPKAKVSNSVFLFCSISVLCGFLILVGAVCIWKESFLSFSLYSFISHECVCEGSSRW